MKELPYIHRLKKLPTSASKQILTDPKVRKLKHTIVNLQKSGNTVKLYWIPGLAGIPGNEFTHKKTN